MSKKELAKFTDLPVARQKEELEKAMLALQDKDELCIPINEAQAAIRTDMEFSVVETKYILECLHNFMEMSEETYQLAKTDEEAEAGREAAEEFAAFIALIEKAKSLSKNGKYVIPMTFWEMDAFLSPFEMEREMFDLCSKTELRQRKKYVEVVTDIDERFKPVYNQIRDGVMPIFGRLPAESEPDDFEIQSIPPIESELEKEIVIELAAADTQSILTCLTQTKEFHENMDAEDSADEKTKDFNKETVPMLLKIIAKIKAAKSTCLAAMYTVRLTFWELHKILAALEGETNTMLFQTDAENHSKKKYYDTIHAVYELLQPVYEARNKAIWPNGYFVNQYASTKDPAVDRMNKSLLYTYEENVYE